MTRDSAPLDALAAYESGRLDRPVVSPSWPVATDIRLDSARACLRWKRGHGEPTSVEPGPGLLEDFVTLRDAPPTAILRYARRWGVLYLCEHDFPAGHPVVDYWPNRAFEGHACPFDERGFLTPEALEWNRYRLKRERFSEALVKHYKKFHELDTFKVDPPEEPPEKKSQPPRHVDHHSCFPRGHHDATPWEPIAAWREWARRAYALLEIAAALRSNKMPTGDRALAAFGGEHLRGPARDRELAQAPKHRAEWWSLVERVANLWLGAARVRPLLVRANGGLQLALGSSRANSPLFGAIAVQLALTVCGAEGFAVCSGCKTLFAPTRKPREGDRSYCQACRDAGVPQRDATAEYRKRMKTQRKRAKGR